MVENYLATLQDIHCRQVQAYPSDYNVNKEMIDASFNNKQRSIQFVLISSYGDHITHLILTESVVRNAWV